MTDGHLVARFLDLNLLEAYKAGRFYLDRKLSLDVVFLALFGWALDDGCELLGGDDIVDFKSAKIAGTDGNLDARLDIARSSDDAPDGDKRTDLLGSDFPELGDVLLSELSWHNHKLVVA